MFKTFIGGVLLGIAGAAAALYFLPVVDQHRESSIISVTPNGGNSETFHINVPMDRIMIGAPAMKNPLPAGLEWPEDELLGNLRTELFKVRDAREAVIGVASRVAATDAGQGDIVEWVLHFPARGSMYVTMQSEPVEGGYRVGTLRTGSDEFEELSGRVVERWVADSSGADNPATGRIELVSSFVGPEEELPDEEQLL
ncbi:MAG: hypothetical protein QNJ07_08515 [Woeseiaceae bacterium]|nr:hypothetical protein [Woeseiaceae bacterium]